MKTNYSWIVPFSWVICVLRVDQILSIKSSVWTLFWTCRLNEFHLTSKRHVTNRTAQKQQEFLILRRDHHGNDRQLFHYFLLPWDTHKFIIMVNSQLSKQNVQYYKTISLWAQLCIPSRLRLKVLRWPVNDSPIGLSCYSEVFTTQKY